jgi:hypothetical protein
MLFRQQKKYAKAQTRNTDPMADSARDPASRDGKSAASPRIAFRINRTRAGFAKIPAISGRSP